MRKQIANDEIVKMIEREQVISYKRKNQHKPVHKQSKQDEQDFESAQSLKSNVFSQDSVRFYKKNTPLPQLGKDRRRLMGKGLSSNENKIGGAYLEKEVRQHDNLALKQQNNQLTTENMKLKTKLMTLEKENIRLQKMLEDDSLKTKVSQPVSGLKQQKLLKLNPQSNSIKVLIRNLKKQLDDVKRQNTKIKWSIKFTRINELQCERDSILEETLRLRAMIEEEIGKRVNIKIKQHGLSHLESKISSIQERNNHLAKENAELHSKLKKVEQNNKKNQKFSENEKNLNKMLFNARRVIKEKEKEIQQIKSQGNVQSLSSIPGSQKNTEYIAQSTKETSLNNSKKQIPGRRIPSKEKRVMSKSAQKYRSSANRIEGECDNCKRLSDQNNVLLRKIEEITLDLKIQKEKSSKRGLAELSKGPIDRPKSETIQTVGRFLIFRFKAHHLSLQQAQKYLISNETTGTQSEELSVAEIVQSLIAEPFSMLSSSYLEASITAMFYANDTSNLVTFDENKKIKKEQLAKNFRNMVKPYDLMSQSKQEQMFIQIAELITNYHQHILTALNGKRNGEGTIGEADLTFFFNEIELEKEYVDFIITQIILESYDLTHLNYYAMFEIFYMPTQQLGASQPQQVGKKRFQVDYANVVKEEDEQYQQSRSYVDAKQKTQSRRQEDEEQEQDYDEDKGSGIPNKKKAQSFTSNKDPSTQSNNRNLLSPNLKARKHQTVEKTGERAQMKQEIIAENVPSSLKSPKKGTNQIEDYQQLFEEEKTEVVNEQDQMNQHKVYQLEEQVEEYQQEFES